MSFIQKLRISISALFIVTIAGAISVAAQTQTQTVTGSYPTSTILKAEANSGPKQAEAAKPSTMVAVSNAPEKSAEVSLETSKSTKPADVNPDATNSTTVSTAPADPPQAPDDDKWQFQVSPYFWLASLHGTGGVGNRTTQVDESFGDIFDSLKFAFMGVFEARKNKLIVLTDLEYVSIEDERATPGPLFSNLTAGFKTFIFDPEVGYRVFDNGKGGTIDVLGGVRIWHVSTDLNFGAGILPATQIQGSRTWVDGIAGLRGKAALSDKVFVTGKFDLGGGGSKFSWQLFGGAGYNITPKIALIGGYRVLDVNYNKNNFIYDMNQRGPIMGVGFKF